MSQLFLSGGQSTGASASASVLPMIIEDWFPLGWTGWISLPSKGLSIVFSNTTVQSIHSLVLSFLYGLILISIHDYWKNHCFEYVTFVGKLMPLFFIWCLGFYSFSSKEKTFFNVTICSDFGVQESKVCHCFHCFPILLPWSDGAGCYNVSFCDVGFEASFFTLLFHLHQEVL